MRTQVGACGGRRGRATAAWGHTAARHDRAPGALCSSNPGWNRHACFVASSTPPCMFSHAALHDTSGHCAASPEAMCSKDSMSECIASPCAQLVRTIMDEAAAAGLNLVRAWAHASSPEYALQPSPGRFSEPVFRGLDYALDQARQRGLKVSASPSSIVKCKASHMKVR